MKQIYASSRLIKYDTEKGNKIEVYKEKIGGKVFWFVAVITKKKIYNIQKDFTSKASAIDYAKKLVEKKKF